MAKNEMPQRRRWPSIVSGTCLGIGAFMCFIVVISAIPGHAAPIIVIPMLLTLVASFFGAVFGAIGVWVNRDIDQQVDGYLCTLNAVLLVSFFVAWPILAKMAI